ncbi:MAG: tetratricopeptide repeat protein [Acidobacteriota bacterium]
MEPLPQGIDCQRCHGPGRRHVQLAQTAGSTPATLRAAIVNPARLSPERREEVCIQCHLESTSFPLPNSLQRYGQGPFAYRPGLPLSDYWLFFDHAPAANRTGKFELVNAVYRIRQSKCYLANPTALGCTTCHSPHDVPRAEAATRHYDAACRTCHTAAFNQLIASGRHTATPGCAECHMPKRRTEDVVHAVVTDHLIQRLPPPGDLAAPLPERHESGDQAYRGQVALYYPEKLRQSLDNDLYLALAQVIDKSNLSAGIPQLAVALSRQQRTPPAQPRVEFTLALAEAWHNAGSPEKALPLYRDAAARSPRSVFALQKLATALRDAGQPAQAITILQQAAALNPNDPTTWHELGLARRAQGNPAAAIAALQKAIALDPNLPEPHSNLGIVHLSSGDNTAAEAAFREAIRIQPSYADAHNNLANLLSSKGDFPQARLHFETAIRLNPADARTRYNFAMALGRARDFNEAQRQLEAALQSDPALAEARLILAQILLAKGDTPAAIAHLQKAAAAQDPGVRKAAADLLRELGVGR